MVMNKFTHNIKYAERLMFFNLTDVWLISCFDVQMFYEIRKLPNHCYDVFDTEDVNMDVYNVSKLFKFANTFQIIPPS